MARSSRRGQAAKTLPVVLLLAVMAVALAAMGGWQLQRLAGAFSTQDVAYIQTPRTFQSWLVEINGREMSSEERVELIARRFLLLPMPARIQVVIAMAQPGFWTEISKDFPNRIRIRDEVAAAVEVSLSRAPVLGDMWFLSAKLDIDQQGMTDESLRKLQLSGTYSPKEGPIALGRLLIMQLNWPFLDEPAKQLMTRDFIHVAAANPQKAGELYDELEPLGLELPRPPDR